MFRSLLGSNVHDPGPQGDSGEGVAGMTMICITYLATTGILVYEKFFKPKKIQELAIIVTARAMDCQYVWNAHAPAARNQGVPDALVDAIRDKSSLPNLAPDESAIINYASELFQTHKVSTTTFDVALNQFGSQHLVEITALIGHYAQTSMILNTFEVTLPDDRTEVVLPV